MLRGSAKRFDAAMMWLSRTLGMLVVMVGPALLGHFLDQRLGTGPWLVTIGVVAGMGLFIVVLSVYTRQFGAHSSDASAAVGEGGGPQEAESRRDSQGDMP